MSRLYLVTGFLGAGKTTFLRQFLSLFRGLVGVVAFGIVLSRLWGEIGIWLAPVASEGVKVIAVSEELVAA